MGDTLSIQITPGMRRQLATLCKRQNRRISEVVREALRAYLAVERFRELRARTLPRAAAHGFLTDEDVFRAVS